MGTVAEWICGAFRSRDWRAAALLVLFGLPFLLPLGGDYSGPWPTVPGYSAESLGMVGNGVCSPNCGGTDNTPAFDAAVTKLCALPQISNNHIVIGRAIIHFDKKNYYFNSSPVAVGCSGLGFDGQSMGGTVLSAANNVTWLQFGAFSTIPADYFSGGASYYTVNNIEFFNSANTVSLSRVGTAIMDNGSGVGTITNIHCVQVQYCVNTPYGGQFDHIERIFVEYTDVGVYIGPGANQFHAGKVDCQFVVECGVHEGVGQVVWDESPNCAVVGIPGTSDQSGSCFTFEANQANTRQGVWICPGTPGSAVGCGGYTLDWRIIIDHPWIETNAGGLGYEPLYMVRFQGNMASDAMRGVTLNDPYFVMGGTQITGAAIFGSTAAVSPQRIRVNGALFQGASRQFIAANINGLSVQNWRTSNGSTTPNPFNSGGSIIWEPTPQNWVALTDAASVTTNATLANNFTLTPTQNFTLAVPTNAVSGNVYTWRITQDGTGGRIISYNSVFTFDGADPTAGKLDPTSGSVTVLTCLYNGVTFYCHKLMGLTGSYANQGNANAVSYVLDRYTYGGGSHISSIMGQTTTSVTTSPITIFTCPNDGCKLWVSGCTGTVTNNICTTGNGFMEEVTCSQSAISAAAIDAITTIGSPAARTYSNGGSGACRLTMATGTYSVNVTAMAVGAR